MSAKHTPGPWKLKADLGIPLQIMGAPTKQNPRYNPVTRCGTTFIAPTSAEAMANARLIAAAPDLLAALKWLDNWLGHKPMPECSNRIAAAIAKATGEEAP